MRRHEGRHGERDTGKLEFARDDPPADSDTPTQEESTETLGRLINDYDLLSAALPATVDGSDLQNSLTKEINHKKEIIFQKFGQIVPDAGAPGTDAPPTTVSSSDGSVMTVIPMPGGGIIIAQNGQNTTVSLGAVQPPPTSTVGPTPTSTSTVVTMSTSTASPATEAPATPPVATAATTTSASPSPSKHNGAGVLSPFDVLPTTMAMKSLLTVTGAMVFGAWTVL
ncbi:hypothetical protein NP233_g1990 [Leucocoprinus birnbaumii]|uniref:Uncharacterized protein n=1 Tax=Leucocoprinus birnbaumii TaxID=56174 RepID=A0AAD5YU88_9AGAR|nr:hypothetical protein NP233_g1990 [Leucocoprinus birnbaumii]